MVETALKCHLSVRYDLFLVIKTQLQRENELTRKLNKSVTVNKYNSKPRNQKRFIMIALLEQADYKGIKLNCSGLTFIGLICSIGKFYIYQITLLTLKTHNYVNRTKLNLASPLNPQKAIISSLYSQVKVYRMWN